MITHKTRDTWCSPNMAQCGWGVPCWPEDIMTDTRLTSRGPGDDTWLVTRGLPSCDEGPCLITTPVLTPLSPILLSVQTHRQQVVPDIHTHQSPVPVLSNGANYESHVGFNHLVKIESHHVGSQVTKSSTCLLVAIWYCLSVFSGLKWCFENEHIFQTFFCHCRPVLFLPGITWAWVNKRTSPSRHEIFYRETIQMYE